MKEHSPVSLGSVPSFSTNDEARRLHGTVTKDGHQLVTLDLDGASIRVTRREPRMDLQIASWTHHHPRAYDDIELADGRRLIVYRCLYTSAWFLAE